MIALAVITIRKIDLPRSILSIATTSQVSRLVRVACSYMCRSTRKMLKLIRALILATYLRRRLWVEPEGSRTQQGRQALEENYSVDVTIGVPLVTNCYSYLVVI